MHDDLTTELRRRVLTLDGATGTMLPRADTRRCVDGLVLSAPDTVLELHRRYVDAGADIITTDTFNANYISLAGYGLQDEADRINYKAAQLAREAAGPERYVAGSMGPTDILLSSGGRQTLTYDNVADAYFRQAASLIDGGVDTLLIETICDPLNARAAIGGARRAMRACGRDVPLMLSATLTEKGLLPSGHTPEEFLASVSHARPLSIGLNCGFGPGSLLPYVERLQPLDCCISLHANAGLPDRHGHYNLTPERMIFDLRRLLEAGKVNIVGGCCGTGPEHIRLIARAARCAPVRVHGHGA